MQKVSSYVMTLQGTKPANAKEPQGEAWLEIAVPNDSLSTVSAVLDTTKSK
jgi:cytochrome c oxidase cbb3-type subunit 3